MFFARRLLTNTVPLSPSASERASGMPSAQTSTLNPAGTFSVFIGSSFASRPVIWGANGWSVELAWSGFIPCFQGGGAAGACARAATLKDVRTAAAKALQEFMSPPFLTALGVRIGGPEKMPATRASLARVERL